MTKEFIGIIVFSLLSSFLIFLSKDSFGFNYLISNNILSNSFNVNKAQSLSFLIGIVWAGLWLPIRHLLLKRKYKQKQRLFENLIEYHKMNYFDLIKEKIKEYNIEFKTRIFKPTNNFTGLWNKYINGKQTLKLINVKGISDQFHHKTLQFDVSKTKIEGMVGKSYQSRALCVDFDLENNNYELTETQKTKIGRLEFCSTIPIFDAKQKNVTAIVSIDSKAKLKFTPEQKKEWEDHITFYAAFIDKHTNL